MAKSPGPVGSPDRRFRGQIEAALADGADLGDMTLKLTLRDVSLLTRDRSIPVADISYSDGQMRFLGVRIEKGGVAASELHLGPA